MSLDPHRLRRTLAFAFEGVDIGDALDHPLEGAALPESGWDPDCFKDDLFVAELVERCLGAELEGRPLHLDVRFLAQVLSHPPNDPRIPSFRRAILAELADPAARKAIERLYGELVHLRLLFRSSTEDAPFGRSKRRLETLAALRRVIELAKETLPESSSGLARISSFGRSVADSEGYRNLVQLLDYENNLARVSLEVGLGADGRVRRMAVRRVEENETNRFYQSPLGRLFSQIILLLRGFRVTRDEIAERWLDTVYNQVDAALPPLFQLLGHLEFYLAALAFRDRCLAKGLAVCFPEMVEDGGRSVEGLFNPLLLTQGIVPTPCDLETPSFDTFTVVTGPNSGGKTRLMQALGIAQMLAQSGFYVPARTARLRSAKALFVSLNEAPAVDQKEGRLGMELLRIRRLFERSPAGALVIFDELCSGTNPSEGEQIFTLVVSLLHELRPEVFITTHFLQFAARLSAESPAEFAFRQVELDANRRPTYRFLPGVATTSLASETAARLGVTREELIALIRQKGG